MDIAALPRVCRSTGPRNEEAMHTVPSRGLCPIAPAAQLRAVMA